MSTSDTSSGNPSLDAGTPATSGAGTKASETERIQAVYLTAEADHVLSPLIGALALARFAMLRGALFNGALEGHKAKNADGLLMWDRVDWLPVRSLLKQAAEDAHAFACGVLGEVVGSFENEFNALQGLLWELTHPMLFCLRDETQDELTEFGGREIEQWLYTLRMFERQAAIAEAGLTQIRSAL